MCNGVVAEFEHRMAILEDMRIAIITESFPPDVNGVAHCVVRVAENLVRKGHHPLVIAPESSRAVADDEGVPNDQVSIAVSFGTTGPPSESVTVTVTVLALLPPQPESQNALASAKIPTMPWKPRFAFIRTSPHLCRRRQPASECRRSRLEPAATSPVAPALTLTLSLPPLGRAPPRCATGWYSAPPGLQLHGE